MDSTLKAWREDFVSCLAQPLFVEALFDRMPDMVFSVKDRAGRYITMSQACAERCGLAANMRRWGERRMSCSRPIWQTAMPNRMSSCSALACHSRQPGPDPIQQPRARLVSQQQDPLARCAGQHHRPGLFVTRSTGAQPGRHRGCPHGRGGGPYAGLLCPAAVGDLRRRLGDRSRGGFRGDFRGGLGRRLLGGGLLGTWRHG